MRQWLCLLGGFVLCAGLNGRGAIATVLVSNSPAPIPTNSLASNSLLQQGKHFYQSGQYREAAEVLQRAAESLETSDRAIALSNLALTYQKLGQWSNARNAIAASLETLPDRPETRSLRAQIFHIRGQLQLRGGDATAALDSWERAATLYAATGDDDSAIAARINQAEAQRASGAYLQARKTLERVNATLGDRPDSRLKASLLLSLGNTLRSLGQLGDSELNAADALNQSLEIARNLQLSDLETEALLGLGHLAQAEAQRAKERIRQVWQARSRYTYQSQLNQAYDFYQQAINTKNAPIARVEAQLNQISILLEQGQRSAAATLTDRVATQLTDLPSDRETLYARINLAERESELVASTAAARRLAETVDAARQLGDRRAESFALGTLGKLYERQQQWQAAQQVTEGALLLSQAIRASDLTYRWQWQLGRVLRAQGKREPAIAAYGESVKTLQSLRNDLVAIAPDLQFSFRESVEPVYRERVALLLQPKSDIKPSQDNLKQALETIEALQLAELDNFFREACLETNPIRIDEIDPNAAILYTILVGDRIESIVSQPGQPLRHYSQVVPPTELETVATKIEEYTRRDRALRARGATDNDNSATSAVLQYSLSDEQLQPFQRGYDWLIRPMETELAANNIETLVFVLDGALRNIPIASLHDGERYLIQNYAVAIVPGLQLLPAREIEPEEFNTLAAGLSEMPDMFSDYQDLPGVRAEIDRIEQIIPSSVLLDRRFTSNNLETQIQQEPFPIVHLATHGQFSSNVEETFILSWDRRINITQLSRLLKSRETGQQQKPIELLVLSACQTALGDDRATLGLAGVAVRAGARSTLASLWSVDDAATALLMSRFYQYLADDPTLTKAEALQRAQVSLLQHRIFKRPSYWAAFVLVGNWQ